MKQLTHALLAFLFVCLVAPAFAQDTTKDEEKSDSKSSRTNGLRRITPPRHWDFDEEAIEVNVERAVEHAMRSVEVALEKMEFHMSPMNFNMKQIDVAPVHVHIPNIMVEPVEVNVPPVNVTIPAIAIEPIEVVVPPINVNVPAVDVNIDHHFRHHRGWDDDDHKHKSREDKEKTKGLKKIN